MEVEELYSQAHEQYEAKNFDEALKSIENLKAVNPYYLKTYLLEARIYQDSHDYLKEIAVLKKFLSQVELTDKHFSQTDISLECRNLKENALSCMGTAYRHLGMPQTSITYLLTAAKLSKDNISALEKISATLFAACHAENFSPAAEPPCIKNGYVTFGCFNKFGKVTDSILQAWKKILDAVPNSRLILKHKLFATDDGKKFVSERLKSFGFDLARVEMRKFDKGYLHEYGDIDIQLDTFPYTGGVTTCEALHMGVPVINRYGDRHGTRFGLSILSNIGLEGFAVDNFDDYTKMAIALANDWDLLKILRKNLRGMMEKSPLMDSASYIRDVEKVFIKILHDEEEKFS